MSENFYALTIGDWSYDGHSLYRQYAIKTNETLENIRVSSCSANLFCEESDDYHGDREDEEEE